MSDLDVNQKAKLLALKQERDAQKPAETQVEQIINSGAIPDAKKEEVVTEAVPEPTLIVDKQKEEASTTNPQEQTSEEVEFKWDSELEQPAAQPSSGVDLRKLGSALSLEATNEEEFVKTVGEKLSKLKELEEQSSKVFEGIPSYLKEAIDIAKKGGDVETFIGNSLLDPNRYDPIDLFETEYERVNAHRFKKPDGTIDYEALDAEMDNIPDGYKSMQGMTIKQQLIAQQQQRKQAIVAESLKAQERFTKELTEAAKELPQFFPKEEWGVNVEPKHAASVVDGIMNGKLVKKHLGDIDQATLSKLDAKKLTKLIFLAEAGKNIVEFSRKQGIVAGKRELLDKTQNPQVIAPSISAAPDISDDKKSLTAVDKLKKIYAKDPTTL
jgi:hypothetical protein